MAIHSMMPEETCAAGQEQGRVQPRCERYLSLVVRRFDHDALNTVMPTTRCKVTTIRSSDDSKKIWHSYLKFLGSRVAILLKGHLACSLASSG